MIDEYRYYLTRGANEIQITPANIPDLKTEVKRPVETCKGFRKVLTGNPIIAEKYPYEWLLAIKNSNERTSEILFKQQRRVSGTYIEDYRGYFTTASCKFDENRRTVEISHEPDDDYRKILEGYDDEVNFLSAPANGSAPTLDFDTWYISQESGSIPDGVPYLSIRTYDESSTTPPERPYVIIEGITSDDSTITDGKVFIHEVITVDEPDISSFDQTGWEKSLSEGVYFRRPSYDFQSGDFKAVLTTDINLPAYSDYRFFNQTVPSNTSYEIGVKIYPELSSATIPNTRKLVDVLKYMVGQIDSDIEPSDADDISLFFSQSYNYFDTGFVTNAYKDVRISQITDIKYPQGTAATTGNLSLKKLLEDLKELGFYWFINSSGEFQLEHFHYFTTLTQTNDLTASEFSAYTANLDSYEYLKDELPKIESFLNRNSSFFPSALNGSFRSLSINYDDIDRVQDAESDEQPSDISTIVFDVLDIIKHPDNYSNSLVCIFAVDTSGDVARSSNDAVLNHLFSFPEIAEGTLPIFKYGRQGSSGTLDYGYGAGLSVDFESTINLKKQTTITVPFKRNESWDFIGKWETSISDQGELESATITHLQSGSVISFDIIHPAENVLTAPSYPVNSDKPTDPSGDNDCATDDATILLGSEGFAILTSDGDYIQV